MRKYYKGLALTLMFIFSFIVISGGQSAHATATIKLWDDVNAALVIADGGLLDVSLASNVITYSGSYGAFSVIVSTGVQSGANSYPQLGLNTFEISSSTGGTLTAWFSNTGFGPTSSPAGYNMSGSLSSITGTGTVSFNSYIDNSNALYGEGTSLGSLGAFSAVASGSTSGSIASLSNPYSLTTKTMVSLGSSSIMQTTTNVAIAPEPISSTLFLVGAATMGFRRLQKNRKG